MNSPLTPTLPTSWYWSEDHFQLEMERIWQHEWICVGHRCSWQKPGAYKRVDIGRNQVIVVRQKNDTFRAFFNTCRHRGAQLCQKREGHLRAGRITCPYHAWSYSLEGKLLAAPLSDSVADYDHADFSLYQVALTEWRGYLFVSLAESFLADPGPLDVDDGEDLAAWPLEELELAHSEAHEIECNWKVFWENFMECYHCPGVHPDLCKLVPRYAQMASSINDLEQGHPLRESRSALRDGAVTWTADGQSSVPGFEGLGQAETEAGMTFAMRMPTMYTVAHVDYVRLVRMLPLAPERTALFIDWMVAGGTLASQEIDIEHLVSASRQVVLEDGKICEVNQQGLRCSRHQQGYLMPLEYDVKAVHDWVRQRMKID